VPFITLPSLKFEDKLAQITTSLRDRQKFYKLRITPNAHKACTDFNTEVLPETMGEHDDLVYVRWTKPTEEDKLLIGEEVRKFAQLRFFVSGSHQRIGPQLT
jgi:actin-related protein 8